MNAIHKMNKLSKKAKFLLLVAMLNLAGMNVAATFVNVFLMRATENNLTLVIVQNMMNHLVTVLAFVLGASLLSKMSITWIMRLGLGSTIFYHLSILILREHISTVIVPLGILSGIGIGLFWFAMNILIGDVVGIEEQGKFFSYQQTVGFIFGVVIPAISGFIIVQFTELTGYYILFGISIALLLVALYLIKNLPSFMSDKKINILKVLKLRGNPYWEANKFLNFAGGLKNAVQAMILMLFAFILFQNEEVIGNFTSLSAMFGIVSTLWFAKKFHPSKQRLFYLVTSLASFATFVLLAIFPQQLTMIFAWIMIGITQNWGQSIASTVRFQLSQKAGDGFHQNEYIVTSEFPIALGRLVGLLVALGVTQVMNYEIDAYRILFVVIGATWMVEYFVINKQIGWLNGEDEANNVNIEEKNN